MLSRIGTYGLRNVSNPFLVERLGLLGGTVDRTSAKDIWVEAMVGYRWSDRFSFVVWGSGWGGKSRLVFLT